MQRLARFNAAGLRLHKERSAKLAATLSGRYSIPGSAALDYIYWVFPVVSAELKKRIPYFRKKGFFLSSQQGICVFNDGTEELNNARKLVGDAVYLPVYPQLPDAELARLEKLLLE